MVAFFCGGGGGCPPPTTLSFSICFTLSWTMLEFDTLPRLIATGEDTVRGKVADFDSPFCRSTDRESLPLMLLAWLVLDRKTAGFLGTIGAGFRWVSFAARGSLAERSRAAVASKRLTGFLIVPRGGGGVGVDRGFLYGGGSRRVIFSGVGPSDPDFDTPLSRFATTDEDVREWSTQSASLVTAKGLDGRCGLGTRPGFGGVRVDLAGSPKRL